MNELIDNKGACCKDTCCSEGCCSVAVILESVVIVVAMMDAVVSQ